MRNLLHISIALAVAVLAGPALGRVPEGQVHAVIHVHSSVSSGEHTIAELAELAAKAGVGAMVLADHDHVAMEYGLYPLRELIKVRMDMPSVMEYGPARYLEEVSRVNADQKAVTVIPGVQSSPFYYWEGPPLPGKLTARKYRVELLVAGMEDPVDYRALPRLHGAPSLDHAGSRLPASLGFLTMALAGGLWFAMGSRWNKTGMAILVAGILLAATHHPFTSSPFDPYHGDQGPAPFQHLIDTAAARGALVFWLHPESLYSREPRSIGPIYEQTRPHADLMVKTSGYTGFSAVYGDTSHAEQPGRQWDTAIDQYCRGRRNHPPWAIAGADFHYKKGEPIDTYQTILWAPDNSREEVLAALGRGSMYAVRKSGNRALRLEGYGLIGPGGDRAGSGGHLDTSGSALLTAVVFADDGSSHPVRVVLVQDGSVVETIEGRTPVTVSRKVPVPSGRMSAVRLLASGPGSQMVANPIFAGTRPGDAGKEAP
ncbi:MAG: hypothetical protein ACLFOY_05810 [Desulfatibacillaceae bacterium]